MEDLDSSKNSELFYKEVFGDLEKICESTCSTLYGGNAVEVNKGDSKDEEEGMFNLRLHFS